MKKITLFIILLGILSAPVFAQSAIDFSPKRRPLALLNQDLPEAYKPSRLIIGQEAKFIIKAPAGSKVSLLVSETDSGAPNYYGQALRLGADFKTIEGMVPEKGVVELGYSLPDDTNLLNKILYFEVAVWKDKECTNPQLAKIMGSSGREADSNGVVITAPPRKVSGVGIMTDMPGMDPQFMQAIDTIKNQVEKGDTTSQYDMDITAPVMLRNLNSPELKQKN